MNRVKNQPAARPAPGRITLIRVTLTMRACCPPGPAAGTAILVDLGHRPREGTDAPCRATRFLITMLVGYIMM